MREFILASRTKKQATLETPPKVILFDLCGTLLDSKQTDRTAIDATLAEFGKPDWSKTRKKKDPLKSMKHNFPNFFRDDYEVAYSQQKK